MTIHINNGSITTICNTKEQVLDTISEILDECITNGDDFVEITIHEEE